MTKIVFTWNFYLTSDTLRGKSIYKRRDLICLVDNILNMNALGVFCFSAILLTGFASGKIETILN